MKEGGSEEPERPNGASRSKKTEKKFSRNTATGDLEKNQSKNSSQRQQQTVPPGTLSGSVTGDFVNGINTGDVVSCPLMMDQEENSIMTVDDYEVSRDTRRTETSPSDISDPASTSLQFNTKSKETFS